MRKSFLRLVMFLLPLFLAACGDVPTGVDAHHDPEPLLSGDCIPNGSGIYVCPPVGSGGGDECDPYHYDCGADDCINSTSAGYDDLQGCGGPGGGGGPVGGEEPIGGGGGGGGGSPPTAPCPDYGCAGEPSPADDDLLWGTGPDCTKPNLLPWEHAFCNSTPAEGERLTRTQAALARISARGGECAAIATFGQDLLASGRVRYFQHSESIHGDYVGWGGPELGVIIAEQWVDNFGGSAGGYANFDLKLAHEVEHAMGRPHVEGTSETANSFACAGL